MTSPGDADPDYDLAPVPAQPVLPAQSAAPKPLQYESAKKSFVSVQPDSTEITPRTMRWLLILIGVGLILCYVPLMFAAGTPAIALWISAYLLVRMTMAIVATLLLAYIVGISFGSGQVYLLRLLAIVTVTDGTVMAMMTLMPMCLTIILALLGSLAICVFLFRSLFDLEMPENAIAALAYWMPGFAGILLVWRATDWLVGLVR